MRMQLRTRFFLWLLLLLLLFIVIQAIVFSAVEIITWKGIAIDGELRNHLMEVVFGVAMNLIALPLLLIAAWLITHRMVEPVKTIAATARRISAGSLTERIAVEQLSADEMRELGSTINSAFDHYHNAMERLKRFSGDASHQLRTPLAAIRAEGEVSLSNDRSPAEYRETIGAMLEDLERLTKIVDQLLSLARLDGAGVARSFKPLALSDVVTRTAEFFRPVCDEKDITLTLKLNAVPTIQGNADLLTELLSNLLDNAIRHTPPKGSIQIRLEHAPDENRAQLIVEDSGPGISADLTKDIFQRFSKAPGQSGGSGLGLAIVADIAQVHGGQASLDTTSSPGACFQISFPANAESKLL